MSKVVIDLDILAYILENGVLPTREDTIYLSGRMNDVENDINTLMDFRVVVLNNTPYIIFTNDGANEPTILEVASKAGLNNLFSLEAGSEIPSNSDLNSILSIGNYRCNTAAIASTLSNSPVNTPFALKVYSVNSTVFIQELIDNFGTRWTRRIYKFNNDTNYFSNWLQQFSIIASINENNDIASDQYSEGDYFIWRGQLYKAIDDIDENDTLSIGTNISNPLKIMDIINELKQDFISISQLKDIVSQSTDFADFKSRISAL